LDGESSFGIIKKSEVFVGLLDGDDIHESRGEVSISSDFSIDLDESLHQYQGNFLLGECVFESVSQ